MGTSAMNEFSDQHNETHRIYDVTAYQERLRENTFFPFSCLYSILVKNKIIGVSVKTALKLFLVNFFLD